MYKNKYLKYKNKYIKYKNVMATGGGDPRYIKDYIQDMDNEKTTDTRYKNYIMEGEFIKLDEYKKTKYLSKNLDLDDEDKYTYIKNNYRKSINSNDFTVEPNNNDYVYINMVLPNFVIDSIKYNNLKNDYKKQYFNIEGSQIYHRVDTVFTNFIKGLFYKNIPTDTKKKYILLQKNSNNDDDDDDDIYIRLSKLLMNEISKEIYDMIPAENQTKYVAYRTDSSKNLVYTIKDTLFEKIITKEVYDILLPIHKCKYCVNQYDNNSSYIKKELYNLPLIIDDSEYQKYQEHKNEYIIAQNIWGPELSGDHDMVLYLNNRKTNHYEFLKTYDCKFIITKQNYNLLLENDKDLFMDNPYVNESYIYVKVFEHYNTLYINKNTLDYYQTERYNNEVYYLENEEYLFITQIMKKTINIITKLDALSTDKCAYVKKKIHVDVPITIKDYVTSNERDGSKTTSKYLYYNNDKINNYFKVTLQQEQVSQLVNSNSNSLIFSSLQNNFNETTIDKLYIDMGNPISNVFIGNDSNETYARNNNVYEFEGTKISKLMLKDLGYEKTFQTEHSDNPSGIFHHKNNITIFLNKFISYDQTGIRNTLGTYTNKSNSIYDCLYGNESFKLKDNNYFRRYFNDINEMTMKMKDNEEEYSNEIEYIKDNYWAMRNNCFLLKGDTPTSTNYLDEQINIDVYDKLNIIAKKYYTKCRFQSICNYKLISGYPTKK